MKLFLAAAYDKDAGVEWWVVQDSPNGENGLNCKQDKALADRLIAAAKEPE